MPSKNVTVKKKQEQRFESASPERDDDADYCCHSLWPSKARGQRLGEVPVKVPSAG